MIERLDRADDGAAALSSAGLQPSRWSASPGTHFARHTHERPKRLFVVRGSISFNGEWLHSRDGIRIPAGFEHVADVGADGVECVEAFE